MKTFNRTILFCLTSLLIAHYANGADEGSFIVNLPGHSRALYELVYNKQLSGKDEGVYYFESGKEDSTPQIRRKHLGVNKRTASSFYLIPPHYQNGSQDALVVLDGNIYLINKHSSEKKSDSALAIGRNQNSTKNKGERFAIPVTLKDPLTNRPVFLESIDNASDLTINSVTIGTSTVIYVSVKQNIPQMGADGVTFAFMRSSDSKIGEFSFTQPVVIDYRFHADDEAILRMSAINYPSFSHSPYLLKTLYERWKNDKGHPLIEAWVKKAKIYLEYFEPNSKLDRRQFESRVNEIDSQTSKSLKLGVSTYIPCLDLSIGTSNIAESVMSISGVDQFFNPLSDGLSFRYEGSPAQKGRLNWDLKEKKFLTRTLSKESAVEVLFSLDKNILLRLKAKNESIQVVDLKAHFEKLRFDPFSSDNEVLLESFDVPSDQVAKKSNRSNSSSAANHYIDNDIISGEVYRKHYLIISGKAAHYPNGGTFVIELEERMGHITARDTQVLCNYSNFSHEELRLRTVKVDGVGIMFDNTTPRVGPKTYKKDSDKLPNSIRQSAYINMSESDPKKKVVFLQPRLEIPIVTNPSLKYREFNHDKNSLNPKTGVYLVESTSTNEDESLVSSLQVTSSESDSFIPGQLIFTTPKGANAKKKIKDISDDRAKDLFRSIIYKTEIHVQISEHSKSNDAFNVYMFGMLPKPSNEASFENKFQLVTLFDFNGTPSDSIKSEFFAKHELPFSFSQIEGVRIFKGLRKYANKIYLMLFLKRSKNFSGGVYLIGLEIKSAVKNGLLKFTAEDIMGSVGWLSKTYVTANRIPDRVYPDADGALYWVDTPNDDYYSARYRMRPFNEVTRLISPSKENVSIKLKERIAQEDEKDGQLFWIGSRWSISSALGLKSVNKVLSKALDAPEAERNKLYKSLDYGPGGKAPLYPLLDSYLDSLANKNETKAKKIFLVVSDEDYINFYNLILFKLAQKKSGWTLKWRPGGNDFELYFFDHRADIAEMRKELKLAAESTAKNVVFAGSDELLQTFHLESDSRAGTLIGSESFSLLDFIGASSGPEEESRGINYDDPENEVQNDARKVKKDKENDPSNDDSGDEEEADGDRDDDEENDEDSDRKTKNKEGEASESAEVLDAIDSAQEDDEEAYSETAKSSSSDFVYSPSDPFKLSGLFMLATEGKGRHLKDLEEAKQSANNVTTLVLTTPKKLIKLQEAHPHEFKAGLTGEDGIFKVDSRFLTSKWFSWPPNTPRSTSEVRKMSTSALTSDDLQVFPNLKPILGNISGAHPTHKHRIIVVPENIKKLMLRFLMTHWSSRFNVAIDRDEHGNLKPESSWNFRNDHLSIFRFPQGVKVDQDEIYTNMDAMRKLADEKSVVCLADATDLLRNERPLASDKSELKPFKISDPAAMKKTELLADVQSVSEPIDKEKIDSKASNLSHVSSDKPNAIYPHILWWMASEGRRIQPKLRKHWTLRQEASPSFSQIIVATPEQVLDLEKDLGLESHFMDLKTDFDIVHLEYPSVEHRSNILRNLFFREDIRSLNYSFKYNGSESGAERGAQAFLNVTKFLANRIEAVANSLNQEPIEAFVRSYSIFRKSLVDDHKLRRSRIIDENYVERFLAKVFPIPLNYKSLEPEDVLHRIKDTARAAVDLTKLGYAGQLDLKERIFRLILSQTQGSDSSKQIPSSAVFFGETSLGKTFFYEKLIQLLDIKVYDFNRPLDENVQAFVLKVEDLVDSKEESTGKSLSVDDALKHFDNFLSLPLGYRGFILVDDLHKAKNAKILSKVMGYIQNLLNNNLVKVSRLEDKMTIEIPVRNISLFVTVNPASNRKIRDEYVDDQGSIETQIIAALSQVQGSQYEPSILARFSDLINFGDFPREAKASGLISKIRSRSLQELTLSKKLILVNPHILSEIAQIFPKAHARNFLMPVTNALFYEANDDNLASAPLYYVTSSRSDESDTTKNTDSWNLEDLIGNDGPLIDESSTIDSTTLRSQIKKHVVVKPVTFNNVRARLDFTEFNSNSFRINFYNHFINSIQNHRPFRQDIQSEVFYYKPLITSVYLNLKNRSELRYWDLDLSATRFEIENHSGHLAEFQELMSKRKLNSLLPFRLPSASIMERESLEDFLKIKAAQQVQKGQREYLSSLISEIQSIFKGLFYSYYQTKEFSETLPQLWLDFMRSSKNIRDEFSNTSNRIRDLYQRFLSSQGFLNPSFKEVRNGFHSQLTPSDLAIIFLWAIDQAMANLPWDNANVFMMRMLSAIVDEPALSTRAEFAEFAFKTEESPLSPLTVEYVTQLLEGNDLIRDNVAELESAHQGFGGRCEYLLIPEDKQDD